ncbi:hypothetical protein GKA54_24680 [Vibrio parahaemolyticus]|nr:hypothetical protein [Vibrio parahaemolyticus]EGQ8340256.1 hypothetical protein [Vibrio parahaemolyticus]EGQ8372985.1 hypothetical protein [Vibrio parahaemolyticus]EGQ8725292.1 hypothetical protein [Vibrio parahaemolyticus]EGQ8764475.1 hypothetical protein [Vibrio parahaemolyticus]
MAFLLCVGFSGLGGMRKHQYCVPHTLIGRYMQAEGICLIFMKW